LGNGENRQSTKVADLFIDLQFNLEMIRGSTKGLLKEGTRF